MAWAPDYAAVDELAAFMHIVDSVDDVQLAAANTAAARAIDYFTNRQFGAVDAPEARYYTPRWSRTRGAWLVRIDDLMDDTGVTVALDVDGDDTHEHTLADGWLLRPRNAAAEGMPWTELLIRPTAGIAGIGRSDAQGAVEVVAPWGWSAIPGTVHEAALLQGSRFATRRDAPLGVAGSPEGGGEVRLLARVDPDVAVSLARYRRRAVLA